MKPLKSVLLIITAIIAISTFSFAEIPHTINYQGKLTDPSGSPVSDGTYSVTFRIYDVQAGGSPIWYETQSVTTQKGLFDTQIGKTKDLNLAFDKPYYLGIKVGSDTEMTPRQALSSSAYAFKAKEVEQVNIPFYISGFILQYLSGKSIKVLPGVADVAGLLLKTSLAHQITITDTTYWLGTKNTTNAWIYVYIYNSNDTIKYKLSNIAPNLADEYSNTEGVKRYILNASIYYRCVGAVKTDASGNILKFYCDGTQYLYDIPQTVTTTRSNAVWTMLNVSNFVPTISKRVLFGIGGHNSPGFGNPVGVWIRPYGAVWSTDYASGLRKMTCNYQGGLSGNEGIYAQMEMFTDDSQRIEYRTDGFNVFEIKVLAYWITV